MHHARQRYQDYLENQRQECVRKKTGEKRKQIELDIGMLKKKQKQLIDHIEMLNTKADKLSQKAEATRKSDLTVESNSHCSTAKEKQNMFCLVEKELEELH